MKRLPLLLRIFTLLFFASLYSSMASAADWQLENPYPSERPLTSIWAQSEDDVFAVGEGTIIHFDGISWSKMATEFTEMLSAVWGTGTDDVYAVGYYGTILHYDGDQWSPIEKVTTKNLYGIWGSTADNIFAVGDNGTILHYDGNSWQQMVSNSTGYLRSIWGTSATDIFAVGTSGVILHYDGSDWQAMTSNSTRNFYGVWGSSATDVFAVGTSGTILHYDGSNWQQMVSNSTGSLVSIWGSSNLNIFAVDNYGAILHYDGSDWQATPPLPETFNLTLNAVHGTSASHVVVVGKRFGTVGTIVTYDGSNWTETFGSMHNAITGLWGTSSDIYGVAGSVIFSHSDSSGLTEIETGNTNYEDIWASSLTDIFTVGWSGAISHYDGINWQTMTSNTYSRLTSVWGNTADNVYAVGDYGIILHYDGNSWQEMVSNTTSSLHSIWGSSATDVYAVGDYGIILHYDGNSWEEMISNTTNRLYSIWASSATDIYAVGYAGTILHYDGNSWQSMTSNTIYELTSIWGSSATDIYAVGSAGTILHYFGKTWEQIASRTHEYLYDVWGSDACSVYVAGDKGVILHATPLSITLPASSTEGNGVLAAEGVLRIHEPASTDLIITLSVENEGEITLPATVTIAAGDTEVYFDLEILDDSWLDGSQPVFVTASAGEKTASTRIIIHDNESASLSLNMATSASEDAGVLAGAATITISTAVDKNVIVSLFSSDINELTVPATILVAAEQTTATFDITVVEDDEIDAVQTVTVTAQVAGWTSTEALIDIIDNENRQFAITLPANVREGDGLVKDGGLLSLSGFFAEDLTVNLTSDNSSEITVASPVTIPAGATSVHFDLTIIDDTEIDGEQQALITAAQTDWLSTDGTIVIDDNDPGEFRFSSSNYVIEEDNRSIDIKVLRTSSTSGIASVEYSTSDGSANTGLGDYDSVSGTLLFADGEREKTFAVQIYRDEEKEGEETIQLTLRNPGHGASLETPAIATLSIVEPWKVQYPYPAAARLNSACSFSETNSYAVGDNGTILHYNGLNWRQMVSPASGDLNAVWGSSDSNIYAAGDAGLFHFDGKNWFNLDLSSLGSFTYLNSIWGSSASDIFVVGNYSNIFHFNGSTWQKMYLPDDISSTTLFGVWGSSASDVFAVGDSGKIFHYDGNSWLEMATTTTQTLYGIGGSGPNDVYAVGRSGVILHYDGNSWQEMVSGTTTSLNTVWSNANDDVYVGGWGVLLHFNGSDWSTVSTWTNTDVRGILGLTDNNMLAVGGDSSSNAFVAWFNGVDWQVESSQDSMPSLEAVWGSSSSDVFASSHSATYHFDGFSWEKMTDSPGAYALWGSAADDVFAVDDYGTIVHYDGSEWQLMYQTNGYLEDIWGNSATDVFAVGNGANGNPLMLHYDGVQWTEDMTLSPPDSGECMEAEWVDRMSEFTSVWGASANSVYALSHYYESCEICEEWDRDPDTGECYNLTWLEKECAIIYHYDGIEWQEWYMECQGDNYWGDFPGRLTEIWGSSDNDLYILNEYGSLFHTDGGYLEEVYNGSYLNSIWGSSPNDIYAVGDNTIIHYDGTEWQEETNSFFQPGSLYGVWGSSANDVFVVGDQILHFPDYEVTVPYLDRVAFNDIDGNQQLSIGDEFFFYFSEQMDTALIVDGSTDANARLAPSGMLYGSINQSRWSADSKTAIIAITDGFTITGTETVSPTGLTDLFGNNAAGSKSLSTIDTIAPELSSINWLDTDSSTALSIGDQYIFSFSEAINSAALASGGQAANLHLPVADNLLYGAVNLLEWSTDKRQLTLTVTEGYTILGDELVSPDNYVTDIAGNAVTGTQHLSGRDLVAPQIAAITFDDRDGSGTVTMGDLYHVFFNEQMQINALSDNTTDANNNLSPAGRLYGQLNTINWDDSHRQCTIEVTALFSISGNETITPSPLIMDMGGNSLANNGTLSVIDTVIPKLLSIQANQSDPVGASGNFQLTLQFSSRMNNNVEPLLTMQSSGSVQPQVPSGGSWLTTRFWNDTYVTPPIVFTSGMDGEITVDVSGAKDIAANTIADLQSIFTFTLDATPPEPPAAIVVSQNCSTARISWADYSAPADLDGFAIYRQVTPFTSLDELTPFALLAKTARSYDFASLDLATSYYYAVAAMDYAGNKYSDISSGEIYLGRPTPPQVALTVANGADGDTAQLSWTGYPGADLCGFAGFRLYYQNTDFTSVSGLSMQRELGVNIRETEINDLDRTSTYYFAIVGYNVADELNPLVNTKSWHDPYSGIISEDLTIGAGQAKEIIIHETMTVTAGATLTIAPGTTLYFATDTALIIEAGSLITQGTALEPVVFTSMNEQTADTAAPGDWLGVTIADSAHTSELNHLFVNYGQGLTLDAADVQVNALTLQHNELHGLRLINGTTLTTSAALITGNDVGIQLENTSQLIINDSVVKQNGLNISHLGLYEINATNNWWGTTDTGLIEDGLAGSVNFTPYLDYEPLLTPAIGPADGQSLVGERDVEFTLACRTAEEMRISEDSTFVGSFFEPFTANATFSLSEGGGDKTVFVQFRSSTATISDPVSVTVTYVTDGPIIDNFSLTEGQLLQRPLQVTAAASTSIMLDTLSFYVDGVLVDESTSPSLAIIWDIRNLDNRVHRVRLVATDEAGNTGIRKKNIIIDLTPPPAPQITEPATDINILAGPVTIRGTAEPFVTVRLSRNSFVMGETSASADGSFIFADIALVEGSNEMMVLAQDEIGVSGQSNLINVILDSGPPSTLIMLDPQINVGAGIFLQWQFSELGERASRFQLYRHSSDFSDLSQATLIGETNLLSHVDKLADEGVHFYAVVGLDEAGNSSDLSNVVSVDYDNSKPLFSISYDSSPIFGMEEVGIVLMASEQLAETPTLTITPWMSSYTHVVVLTADGDTSYRGNYAITENFPSGKATIRVSGRDLTGNSFSGVPNGVDFIVDTDGPVAQFVLNEELPIQIISNRSIDFTLDLDEPVNPVTSPVLQFQPPLGEIISVPLTGAGMSWSGTINLTPDMGSGNGRFIIAVEDSLANQGGKFSSGEYVELYNTEFPAATSAPANLTAATAADGAINLSWPTVTLANSYHVYRSDGNCETTPDTELISGLTANTFQDIPPADGIYCYAVTANRLGAESSLSGQVGMLSDRIPPMSPEGLAVVLGVSGIDLSWQQPLEGQTPTSYFVYRNGSHIRSLNALAMVDYPHSGGSYQYVIAAVDEFGNENPGEPVTFDLTVGAVSDLQIFVQQGEVPKLSWQSNDASVVGYNVYRSGMKQNDSLLVEPVFSDEFYTSSSVVHYEVTAVNSNGDESPARIATVYPINMEVVANPDANGMAQPIVAGYFDNFAIRVENEDELNGFVLKSLQYRMTAGVEDIYTATDTSIRQIDAGDAYSTTKTIPSGDSLDDHYLRVLAEQDGDDGVQVTYEVGVLFTDIIHPAGGVSLSIDNSPLAGGYATINVCFVNQGYGAMDIIASRDYGAQPGDISVALVNEDGLEINRGWYTGLPSGVSMSADGIAYMNLDSGASFCVNVEVLVPANLPDGAKLTFVGSTEQLYSDMTAATPVTSTALSGSYLSAISQTEYYGSAQADRDYYADTDTVIISGQAIDRTSDLALPHAALKVGFSIRGYQWFKDIVADENGDFVFEYNPAPGLSGNFTIWAAHPDVFDTIRQDEFDFYRMYCKPSSASIRMSKADSLRFSVELYNPGNAPLSGFDLKLNGYSIDEEGNEIVEPSLTGLADFGTDFALQPGQRKRLYLELHADVDAPDSAIVEFVLTTAEGSTIVLPATVSLLPAVPVISIVEPASGYVDLSLNRGNMQVRTITVTNTGLQEMLDVEVVLPGDISWMMTNLPTNAEGKVMLGDIPVGGSKTFDMVFAPPVDTEFGYHQDHIILRGSNSEQDFTINLFAMITSSLKGSMQFIIKDMLGQEVEGATIRMRNTLVQEEISPVESDFNGEVMVDGLQDGAWSWQVVADGHSSISGMVKVVPDQVTAVDVLLYRSFVTVEFSVEPVPFTDRYEIKLEQTFETHVPVPVFVIDPPSFTLKDVKPGFETTLMVTAKNMGLIKIHDVSISSASTEWGSMRPLIDFIPELNAMQEVEIPFRLVYNGEDDFLTSKGVLTDKGAVGDWLDCSTGGIGGMGDTLKTLANAFGGRSSCQGDENLAIAAGMIAFLHVWNLPLHVDPRILIGKVITNAISCLLQQVPSGNYDDGDNNTAAAPGPGSGVLMGFNSTYECFAAGTPILMADGSSKVIEEIVTGDQILSFSGEADRVKQTHRRQSEHVREIWFRNDAGEQRRLETTDEHLFWTMEKEWQPARKLVSGDLLLGSLETSWEVVKNERQDRTVTVYNFDVDQYRSYFANGVLVHERCGVMDGPPDIPPTGSPEQGGVN